VLRRLKCTTASPNSLTQGRRGEKKTEKSVKLSDSVKENVFIWRKRSTTVELFIEFVVYPWSSADS